MAQGWRIHLQCRRHRSCGFSPWVREIPWRQKQQPTPVLLPGESHGQRSLAATVHRVTKSQTWLKRPSMHACLWSEFYGILSSKNLKLSIISLFLSSVPPINICCCSVAKSCLTLCDSTDYSMPGSSVLHYLLEFAQIHIHWVGKAIQPSHPLLPPYSAFNLSQHHGLFQWVDSSYQVAKVLEL